MWVHRAILPSIRRGRWIFFAVIGQHIVGIIVGQVTNRHNSNFKKCKEAWAVAAVVYIKEVNTFMYNANKKRIS